MEGDLYYISSNIAIDLRSFTSIFDIFKQRCAHYFYYDNKLYLNSIGRFIYRSGVILIDTRLQIDFISYVSYILKNKFRIIDPNISLYDYFSYKRLIKEIMKNRNLKYMIIYNEFLDDRKNLYKLMRSKLDLSTIEEIILILNQYLSKDLIFHFLRRMTELI
jgi:hypothetical protein